MDYAEHDDGTVRLSVSRDELRILSNSLGVALETFFNDPAEFSTRVGAEYGEGKALKREFREMSQRLPQVP